MIKLLTLLLLIYSPPVFGAAEKTPVEIKTASKKFTESVILGEIITQIARTGGARATHRSQLGGTRILWSSLISGEIDIYPEYTGTIAKEIFSGRSIKGRAAVKRSPCRARHPYEPPSGIQQHIRFRDERGRGGEPGD